MATAKFLPWLWCSSIPPRMRTVLVRGHLTDELLEVLIEEQMRPFEATIKRLAT